MNSGPTDSAGLIRSAHTPAPSFTDCYWSSATCRFSQRRDSERSLNVCSVSPPPLNLPFTSSETTSAGAGHQDVLVVRWIRRKAQSSEKLRDWCVDFSECVPLGEDFGFFPRSGRPVLRYRVLTLQYTASHSELRLMARRCAVNTLQATHPAWLRLFFGF